MKIRLLGKDIYLRYVSFLLIATFAVAAPRYMGVFGQIVGVDLVQASSVFRAVEIWSGLAMGALEALVLEYIIQRVKRMAKYTIWWWSSIGSAVMILVTFPFVTAPYMLAMMNGVLIRDVLSGEFQAGLAFWGWTFLVASLIPLIVAAIGIVRDDWEESDVGGRDGRENTYTKVGEGLEIPLYMQAAVFLDQWYNKYRREPLPPEMAGHFRGLAGERIEASQADEFILEWRSKAGRVGARPTTPTPGAVAVNGRG